MKTSKVILLVLAVLVIIVAASIFFLVRNLDSLVASAIERYGTAAAGTPVQVQTVEIGLREGRGSVRGLTVARQNFPTGIFSASARSPSISTPNRSPRSCRWCRRSESASRPSFSR